MEQNFSFSAPTESNIQSTINSAQVSYQHFAMTCTEQELNNYFIKFLRYLTKEGKKLLPKNPLLQPRNTIQKKNQIFNDDPLIAEQPNLNKHDLYQKGTIHLLSNKNYLNEQENEFKMMLQIYFPDDSTNQNLDLIFVVDQSNSMKNNGKLQQVQKSIIGLISLLNPNDRISLISFSNYATRHCGFIHPIGKSLLHFQNQLLGLKPFGGTEINQGMKLAIEALKQRKEKNLVTAIFLFSDGQDDKSTAEAIEEEIIINAFGFGEDHDANSLLRIIKPTKGRFYYIENTEMIGECFVDALGAAKSIIAKNARIEIQLSDQFQIEKTYGEG